MADKYISREAALERIREYIEEYGWTVDEHGWHTEKWCAMKEAEDVIETIPAADVKPVVHGEWNFIDKNKYYRYECSVCHERFEKQMRRNYCPNCGADMREVEHG